MERCFLAACCLLAVVVARAKVLARLRRVSFCLLGMSASYQQRVLYVLSVLPLLGKVPYRLLVVVCVCGVALR